MIRARQSMFHELYSKLYRPDKTTCPQNWYLSIEAQTIDLASKVRIKKPVGWKLASSLKMILFTKPLSLFVLQRSNWWAVSAVHDLLWQLAIEMCSLVHDDGSRSLDFRPHFRILPQCLFINDHNEVESYILRQQLNQYFREFFGYLFSQFMIYFYRSWIVASKPSQFWLE